MYLQKILYTVSRKYGHEPEGDGKDEFSGMSEQLYHTRSDAMEKSWRVTVKYPKRLSADTAKGSVHLTLTVNI